MALTKISSAVYLVTSFFNDQEPIKWRLRNLSNDLVISGVKDKLTTAQDLISLFGLARNANLVSEPNYEILAKELRKFIDESKNPLETILISEPKQLKEVAISAEPKKSIKDNMSRIKEFGAVSVKKTSRQATIITLLKRKKEIMIKDVSPLISGCSEKTVQRELAEMVAAGILSRIGEKRWSRYTLAEEIKEG